MPSGPEILSVSILLAAVAALYSSVGHGGASGYLAIMTLFSIPASFMSSTALILNVLVSLISLVAFWRTGYVSLGRLWPFLMGSLPAAFIGGLLKIPAETYSILLVLALLAAAVRLTFGFKSKLTNSQHPSTMVASALGVGIGLLSGIVGIGGGVFLGPILLLTGWAGTRETAGICAGFIFVNSVAGLAGRAVQGTLQVGSMGYLVAAAVAGGIIGSYYGSQKLPPPALRRILALVLLVAVGKLLLSLR